jgi:hypothetical protein
MPLAGGRPGLDNCPLGIDAAEFDAVHFID